MSSKMMDLKEPKRKRRVPPILHQSFPIPIGGTSAITVGRWQVYYGRYLGDCVVVEDPNDMAALYNKGFFGKSSLSRDKPKFKKGSAKKPVFICQRQCERRCMWAKKQQVMVSSLQHVLPQGNVQNISEQVSKTPSKDQFHSSQKEPGSEDVSMGENATAASGTVATDETDKDNEEIEHTTTNTLVLKPKLKTELVELETEDEIKMAVKSSTEESYDVILLDSEEDEAISVVDETRSSKEGKTSKNCDVSQSKLISGKEIDVASEASGDSSIILNESEEKEIRVGKNNKVADAMNNDRSRSDHKRGRREMDADTVPQEKRRKVSGKDKDEIEDANLNKPETTDEKSHASGEDEVILIDMEECSKEGVEGEMEHKQTEIESNRKVDEGNKEDALIEVSQPANESDTTEKNESRVDKSQDSLTRTKVALPNKNTEETASVKPACESKPSAKGEVSNIMETDKVVHFTEPEAFSSDNVDATEKHEENISHSEKTKGISSPADGIVPMEVGSSDKITKDTDAQKTKIQKGRNKNGSADGDDEDLVVVLSDADSDNEEFVKNLNPRLEKALFSVRETLQLMPEEAFFLSFGLGCLQTVDMCGNILTLTQMWQLFKQSDSSFTSKYVAYHYFRSKGWVVKPGIKFGGDFLLYKQGPAFYHSSYIVIVETVDGASWTLDDTASKSFSWTVLHGLVRLAESSGKEILLCQVIKPPDVNQESMDSPSIISKFKVHELLIRRWVSSEERENYDYSD